MKEILPPLPVNETANSNHTYVLIINNSDDGEKNKTNSRRYTNYQDYNAAREERNEAKAAALNNAKWKRQHAEKVAYINQTIFNGYWSALYLFKELNRIKKKRVVMDKMRKMIAHLDMPYNENARATVLQCYRDGKPAVTVSYWLALDTNNLVRHDLKDPYNDNTRN